MNVAERTKDGAAARQALRPAAVRGRVSYNASTRVVGRAAGALITLEALRLTTHYFGASRWGAVVAASAFANVFVTLCDFGLSRVVSREVAARSGDAGAVYGAGLIGGMLVSVGSAALMTSAVFVAYAGRPELRHLSLILVLSLPPNAFWLLSGSVLTARARNDVRGVVDVVSSGFLVAAAGATVALALAASGYVWLTVVADCLTAAVGMTLARRHVRADLRPGAPLVLPLLRRAAPIGASQALAGLATQLDVVVLSMVASASSVGAFGVGFQLAIFGAAVPALLTAAMLPKFVDASPERQQRLMQAAVDTLVLVAAFIPLLALVFARPVLLLLAGRGFAGGAASLVVMSCYAALMFPATAFVDGLIFLRAEADVLKAVVAGTVTNLVLAGSAIPLLGPVAAAASMTAGSAAFMVAGAVLFRRRAGFALSARRVRRVVSVAALLAASWLLARALAHVSPAESWAALPEMAGLAAIYLGLCTLPGVLRRLAAGRG